MIAHEFDFIFSDTLIFYKKAVPTGSWQLKKKDCIIIIQSHDIRLKRKTKGILFNASVKRFAWSESKNSLYVLVALILFLKKYIVLPTHPVNVVFVR